MDKREKPEKKESPKKKYNLRRKTRNSKAKNYKINTSKSDSDSDSDWSPPTRQPEEEEPDTSSSEEEESESSGDNVDALQMQRFIQKIFPSASGKERLEQLEKLDTLMHGKKKKKSKPEKKSKSKPEKKSKSKPEKKSKSKSKPEKKSKSKSKSSDEEEEEKFIKALEDYENQMLTQEIDEEEMDQEDLEDMMKSQNMKFNIVFTVGGNEDIFAEEEDSLSSDSEGEEGQEGKEGKEGKETLTKTSEIFEKNEKVEAKLKDWDTAYLGRIKKVRKNGNYDIELDDESYDIIRDVKVKYLNSITKLEEYNALIADMEELAKVSKKGGKKAMMKHLESLSNAAEKKKEKEKKESDKKDQKKNVKKLRLMLKEKGAMNDFKYFAKMSVEDQSNIIKRLKEVNDHYAVKKPYRISLLESNIPIAFKSQALKKINILSYMDPASGEYYKIKQWVDTFMSIPFGRYKELPIKLSDGKEKCGEFMENAKKILDDCVYGLDDAKMQILQYIGQWISNPSTTGTAIAIKGPPGTGKTTLIKEGISKIMQRPFAFMALGGATDSSFLEGHSYTYEGSTWGKIVDILIQSKHMNPVIFMDELDKISDTPKGEEIAGILTHLTDTAQNDKFHDKYFSNMDFNLSKALFIFSYNDEKKINPILKDRMYRIHTDGYKNPQKLIIARDHLIPKIEKNINFDKGSIIIPDDVLTFITENYTENEKGVRNLKRCLEIIYTKINLYRLMKPDSTLFSKETALQVKFPYTVTNQIVQKLIKKGDDNSTPFGMYM